MKVTWRIDGTRLSAPVSITTALGLLAALAWWAADSRVARADAELREQLIHHAVEMADAINPELARTLTFTAADAGTPAFERLREQMLAYRQNMGGGEVFSMRLRDGVIRFGPETFAATDPAASKPGAVYTDAPSAVIGGLRTEQPYVYGPFQTTYGAFVSAAAPVVDSTTGQVLMVVGINRRASDWLSQVGAARRGPWFAAFVVVLLVAGGALAVGRRNRRVRPETLKFKRAIVVPTVLAMLVGLMFLGSYQYRQIAQSARRDMVRMTEQVERRWHHDVVSQVQILKAQVDMMAGDPALLTAWRDGNILALTAVAQPALQRMTREYGITHFNLVGPDRVYLLRAQLPDQRGDVGDRFTLLIAEKTGVDAWGTEIDTRGAFTLRYVRPWTQAGATMGYLDLGIEFERLIGPLAKEMNVDLLTVIRKAYTTRASFEAGRQALGFVGQWDAYPDFVVAHQTIAKLPGDVARWIGQSHNPTGRTEIFDAQEDGRRFWWGVIELPDAEGGDVMHLIVVRDVTAEANEARSTMQLSLGLAATLFGGVLVLPRSGLSLP